MNKIKLILSIAVCKMLIWAGKLLGTKSSSAPGQIAMKIYPDILKELSAQVKKDIVCTLGTNGKTTTNNMIDLILKSSGNKTVCNNIGANMLFGVVTAFVNSATLFGKLDCDYASIEIDEASAKIVFRHMTPSYIVITNLFRDQLDRYGEIDSTLEHIKKAVDMAPNATLVINADDPLLMYLKNICENKTVTYGISENVLETDDDTKEGKFCKNCHSELQYEYIHYNQLGNYSCPNCGFKRGNVDFSATDIECTGKIAFNLNNEKIESNTYGFYNIYNLLASVSVTKQMNLGISDYSEIFQRYKPQIARMEEFYFGDKTVMLNLSKNPAGFNQMISTLENDDRKKAVVIAINDCESDGVDISWLYDVNFEKLTDYVKYGVSGKRKYDMALRLFYADVCDNPQISDDPAQLAFDFLKTEAEVIYLLVNYTVMFEAQTKLIKLQKEYLKGKKL